MAITAKLNFKILKAVYWVLHETYPAIQGQENGMQLCSCKPTNQGNWHHIGCELLMNSFKYLQYTTQYNGRFN